MSIPAVDYAYLVSIMPELASMPTALVDALNPVGLAYVGANVFVPNETNGKYALALAIAHSYTLGQLRGGGPVTMDKVGDLQTQVAALPMDQGSLGMTTYGLRLRELGRMLAPGGVWIGGFADVYPLPAPFGGPQPTWPRRCY